MTSLAATLSVDPRGPSAIYIMSDSRFTWGSDGTKRWDAAQKTFVCQNSPDIFGFCGDAFFPPTILRTVVDLADMGCIWSEEEDSESRHGRALSMFKSAIGRDEGALTQVFHILHASRQGAGMKSEFKLWKSTFMPMTKTWSDTAKALNEVESVLALSGGTGAITIQKMNKSWENTNLKGKSRAVAWSIFDAIGSGADPLSGGPPQMTGLWRIGNGRVFGQIWRGKKYISGREIPLDADTTKVDWFNANFERCDGKTGKRIESAAKQPRPNLKK